MRPSILKNMPILQPVQDGVAPEFLTIGHVTRDIFPDGSFSLGGTATFAAITARRLGLASAIVTCADAQLLSTLPSLLPAIGLAGHASPASTTFSNQYHEGFRTEDSTFLEIGRRPDRGGIRRDVGPDHRRLYRRDHDAGRKRHEHVHLGRHQHRRGKLSHWDQIGP